MVNRALVFRKGAEAVLSALWQRLLSCEFEHWKLPSPVRRRLS
jgi:hypothetical protein